MSRSQIRLTSYTLSLILVLGIFAYTGTVKAKEYELQLRTQEQRNLSELGEYVDQLKTDLQKGIYSNTPPMMSTLSTELWRDSSGAKDCLSQLSIDDVALNNTYKFLSQVGEFTMSLNRKVANGQEITKEERDRLLQLLNYANNLSKSIDNLRTGIDNGTISTQQMKKGNIKLDSADEKSVSIGSSFTDIEQSLTDYPTLIYDGPFSDHILNKKPQMIQGKKRITKEEAKQLASKYAGTDAKNFSNVTEEKGNFNCYVFTSKDKTVGITQNGGYLCYILGSQWAGEVTLSAEDATARAKNYLSSIGYKSMESTYSMVSDGICTINFAYMSNNVTCYTDLIKVSVSLSDGRIVSVDARGFLTNHQERSFKTPELTAEQAKKNLSHALTVKNVKLANIPTSGGAEKYCYEFQCKGIKDDDVLVYIDTKTGDEIQILMLIHTEGGTLTR